MRLSIDAIVDETVAYYSPNPNKLRGKDEWDSCRYLTDEGEMCAVGRCLINPALIEQMVCESYDGSCGSNQLDKDLQGLDNYLKEEYRGHPIAFWNDLQELHDFESHWLPDDISDAGLAFVDKIKDKYSDKK